ncbi:MAG: histidine kinase [Lentimicrobiaceae bacterium]
MKRKSILLIHFFFWFYIINQALFPLYIGKFEEANMVSNEYFKEVLITTILNMLSFYVIHFSFPYFLKFKSKIFAIFSGLVLIFLITAFRTPVELMFWKHFGNMPEKELLFNWIYVWNNLRLVIIIGIYAILIWYLINAFESQKFKQELINQRQAGELALLRSQVNPHFLFNTLNNIYALVYKKSDEAPDAVMKLSSIMRYMLYDATNDKVPLEKEIEYLKSFIALQKLRIKNPEFILLNIEGNAEGHFIAPMLLISFVENAFKHGSKKHIPGIIINLLVNKDRLNFEVVNYLKKTTLTNNEHEIGMGLSNISRRLELIYPGKHSLIFNKEAETFRVNLVITK